MQPKVNLFNIKKKLCKKKKKNLLKTLNYELHNIV